MEISIFPILNLNNEVKIPIFNHACLICKQSKWPNNFQSLCSCYIFMSRIYYQTIQENRYNSKSLNQYLIRVAIVTKTTISDVIAVARRVAWLSSASSTNSAKSSQEVTAIALQFSVVQHTYFKTKQVKMQRETQKLRQTINAP